MGIRIYLLMDNMFLQSIFSDDFGTKSLCIIFWRPHVLKQCERKDAYFFFWCECCLHMLIKDATDIGGQNELGKKPTVLTVTELQLELYLNTSSSGSQSF